MGGVTLREVTNANVLFDQVLTLITVCIYGLEDVHHFVVVLYLIGYACVDEDEIHSNGAHRTTETVLEGEAVWLTDSFTVWYY